MCHLGRPMRTYAYDVCLLIKLALQRVYMRIICVFVV